ncbi:hypothetical protein F5Y04DRAFT_266802 [Hypomontagnella monticulosa]|nr:hypothetical protein F5Y04DRAFT_266802 [Hypomontagnella monticulosa]
MDNNQPSTENRTFPLFGLLPGELRNAIWDFAATRDERPGAHFFLSHEIRDVDPTNQCVLGDTNDPHESLSAPQYSEDGETKTSWRTNNRSLYITDGGLWTACRESRAAMLRNQRRQPSSETHHPRRTGYFTDYDESGEKGEKQYFSILKHDLVCLQTPDIAQVHFGDALHPRLQDVENIALEFNPDWDFPTSADFFNVLYGVKLRTAGEALAEARYMNRTLWFIDYSIRRTKDPARANTSIRDDRPVFYGKGRTSCSCMRTTIYGRIKDASDAMDRLACWLASPWNEKPINGEATGRIA